MKLATVFKDKKSYVTLKMFDSQSLK